MENPEVAQIFDEVADLLELEGENPFRIRAYRRAAVTVRDLSEPIAKIVAEHRERLGELPGIGQDLAGKIATVVETGDLPLRRELGRQVPSGLRALMTVPGCGPKRAMLLHKQLKVASIDDLRRAASRHAIRELKGFGAKTEDNILKALDELPQSSQRMYLADAQSYADAVLRHLQDCPGVLHIDMAGSYRRRKETVGDLDVLVAAKSASKVMERLIHFEGVSQVLAHGDTKSSVRLRSGLQLDLRAVPEASYGAALLYFTGSKQHNIMIRRLGVDRGLKINEYGVFRGARRIAGRTEEEVYRTVGLPWIPPELREGATKSSWPARERCPG